MSSTAMRPGREGIRTDDGMVGTKALAAETAAVATATVRRERVMMMAELKKMR